MTKIFWGMLEIWSALDAAKKRLIFELFGQASCTIDLNSGIGQWRTCEVCHEH